MAVRGRRQLDGLEDGASDINRYGLGARGIDYLEYTDTNNSGYNSVGFPLYDGHGNMVMTLARSGSTYSTGNQRAYDAWGLIRTGTTSGLPNQRYCANLGHTVDDETGLIYMRARYYEPQSGRFVNEDPDSVGPNWYVYCGNQPVTRGDQSGKAFTTIEGMWLEFTNIVWMIGYARTLGRAEGLNYLIRTVQPRIEGFIEDAIFGSVAIEVEADAALAAGNVRAWELLNAESTGMRGTGKVLYFALQLQYVLAIFLLSNVQYGDPGLN